MYKPDTRRKPHSSRDINRWLIVSEDSESSLNYLRNFFPHPRYAQFVTEGPAGDTVAVVRKGINLSEQARRENRAYIHTWCVFDRDSFHPNRFKEAFALASQVKDLTAVWTNEAFELWYLLHFGYNDTAIGRRDLISKLERHLGQRYAKSDKNIYDKLMANPVRLKDAIKNATRLMSDNRQPETNPSLNVHLLVQKLEGIRQGLQD